MRNLRESRLIVFLVVFLTVASAGSMFLSYRAYSLSLQAKDSYRYTLQTLEREVNRLSTEIANLSQHADSQRSQKVSGLAQAGHRAVRSNGSLPQGTLISELQAAGGKGQMANSQATPSSASDGRATPRNVADHRASLLSRNSQAHQKDEERYGSELASLYDAARSRGPSKSGEESAAAFNQMIEQFPDANATGMAIAEHALESALQGNTAAVEDFYNLLAQNENFADVVTDLGVEALPSIEGYLASQYIQEGNFDLAQQFIDSLQDFDPNTLVAVPGPNGQPEWLPISEVIEQLRKDLRGATSHGKGDGGKVSGGGQPKARTP